jgi:hypothetical protein
MHDLATEQVGHGRKPDVRVRAHVDAGADQKLGGAHLVEKDEGADHLPAHRGQGTLRFVEVANDSRCRPGHQCIWAGDAELVFQWQPAAGAAETFSLHTTKGEKTHAIGERRVELLSLTFDEPPVASLRVDRGD